MSDNISGFKNEGPLGGEYESVCQSIAHNVAQWLSEHPDVADLINNETEFMPFTRDYPDLRTLMAKRNPSAAQAGVGFWAGYEMWKKELGKL